MDATPNGSENSEIGVGDVKVKVETEVATDEDSLKRKTDSLEEDNEENYEQGSPSKRGRGAATLGSPRGRGRGRGRGAAGDASVIDKEARIVLKNIGAHGDYTLAAKPTRGRGRPRGSGGAARGTPRGTPTTQLARTSSGRTRKPTAKVKEEMEKKLKEEQVDEDEVDDDDDEEDSFVEDEEENDDEEEEDEEEEIIPKKKGRGRGRPPATPGRGRGRGRGRGKASAPPKAVEEDDGDEDDEEDENGDNEEEVGAAPATNNDPNAVQTGQFLIDKADMRHLENYPIWRMEGPNMLRKFEMIVQLGRIRHRSLYAYSSWAQTMRDLFEKIDVAHISSVDGESVVEIHNRHMPKAPELAGLEEKYGAHELLPLYRSLLLVLFQQAADPNFLASAYSSEDPTVRESIRKVDEMVQNRIAQIEASLNFTDDFKTRIRDCPNMKSIRRSNWSQTDQSTTDRNSEKGVRSVLLFGFGYEPSTLAEDKTRGAEVAQEIVVGPTTDKILQPYHGLYHVKYHLLRRCQDKAKLVRELQGSEPTLDNLLEDRCWVLQAFEDFLNLFTSETEAENIETANLETANLETANLETTNLETTNLETPNLETA